MKQVSFSAVLPLVVNADVVAGVDRFVRAATLSPKKCDNTTRIKNINRYHGLSRKTDRYLR